jgi:hypothetical protein
MRSVSPWRVLAALLLLAAIVCGVVTAAIWGDFGIEGAYLNESTGKAIYSGISTGDYEASRVMLGVTIGLGVAGLLVLLLSLSPRARRPAPAPPEPAAGRDP